MEKNLSNEKISEESSVSCSESGCGTAKEIAGCKFSLYPMSDKFAQIILGALEKTDISAVWSESDTLSTIYRGKREYIFAYLEDVCKHMEKAASHFIVHITISVNSPTKGKVFKWKKIK